MDVTLAKKISFWHSWKNSVNPLTRLFSIVCTGLPMLFNTSGDGPGCSGEISH